MVMDRPMVATTMGIMPNLKSGSTTKCLNNQPCTSTEPTMLAMNASHRGKPAAMPRIIMKAGSMTNSPCAKLIVPEACQSSVKPSAAKA